MKKSIVVSSFVLIMFLILTGCGGEYKNNIKLGDESLEQGAYSDAIQYYMKALEEKSDDEELRSKIVETKNTYYDLLLEKARVYKDQKKYQDSYEKYQEAKNVYPTKEEDFKEEMEEVYVKNQMQQDLQKYFDWLGPILVDYQKIRLEWRGLVTGFAIGVSDRTVINEHVKMILIESTNLLNEIEMNTMAINGELKNYHQEFVISGTEVNREVYEMLAILAQPETTNEMIINSGHELEVAIKKQSNDYLVRLNEYMQTNGIEAKISMEDKPKDNKKIEGSENGKVEEKPEVIEEENVSTEVPITQEIPIENIPTEDGTIVNNGG